MRININDIIKLLYKQNAFIYKSNKINIKFYNNEYIYWIEKSNNKKKVDILQI